MNFCKESKLLSNLFFEKFDKDVIKESDIQDLVKLESIMSDLISELKRKEVKALEFKNRKLEKIKRYALHDYTLQDLINMKYEAFVFPIWKIICTYAYDFELDVMELGNLLVNKNYDYANIIIYKNYFYGIEQFAKYFKCFIFIFDIDTECYIKQIKIDIPTNPNYKVDMNDKYIMFTGKIYKKYALLVIVNKDTGDIHYQEKFPELKGNKVNIVGKMFKNNVYLLINNNNVDSLLREINIDNSKIFKDYEIESKKEDNIWKIIMDIITDKLYIITFLENEDKITDIQIDIFNLNDIKHIKKIILDVSNIKLPYTKSVDETLDTKVEKLNLKNISWHLIKDDELSIVHSDDEKINVMVVFSLIDSSILYIKKLCKYWNLDEGINYSDSRMLYTKYSNSVQKICQVVRKVC